MLPPTLVPIAIAFVAVGLQTKGPSMRPTFNERGDVVLVEHISRNTYSLKPGDVVISVCPVESHKMICKRLLALEGQSVRVQGAASAR